MVLTNHVFQPGFYIFHKTGMLNNIWVSGDVWPHFQHFYYEALWNSFYCLSLFYIIPNWWLTGIIHMKQEKSFVGFIHLFIFSIHMQYVQFISAQNLSHSLSPTSLHFCAGSSLNFIGMKLWVRPLILFFIKYKLLRILLKFSETFQNSTAQLTIFFNNIIFQLCIS